MKYKIFGQRFSVRSKQLLAIFLSVVMITAFIPMLGVSAEEDNYSAQESGTAPEGGGGSEGGGESGGGGETAPEGSGGGTGGESGGTGGESGGGGESGSGGETGGGTGGESGGGGSGSDELGSGSDELGGETGGGGTSEGSVCVDCEVCECEDCDCVDVLDDENKEKNGKTETGESGEESTDPTGDENIEGGGGISPFGDFSPASLDAPSGGVAVAIGNWGRSDGGDDKIVNHTTYLQITNRSATWHGLDRNNLSTTWGANVGDTAVVQGYTASANWNEDDPIWLAPSSVDWLDNVSLSNVEKPGADGTFELRHEIATGDSQLRVRSGNNLGDFYITGIWVIPASGGGPTPLDPPIGGVAVATSSWGQADHDSTGIVVSEGQVYVTRSGNWEGWDIRNVGNGVGAEGDTLVIQGRTEADNWTATVDGNPQMIWVMASPANWVNAGLPNSATPGGTNKTFELRYTILGTTDEHVRVRGNGTDNFYITGIWVIPADSGGPTPLDPPSGGVAVATSSWGQADHDAGIVVSSGQVYVTRSGNWQGWDIRNVGNGVGNVGDTLVIQGRTDETTWVDEERIWVAGRQNAEDANPADWVNAGLPNSATPGGKNATFELRYEITGNNDAHVRVRSQTSTNSFYITGIWVIPASGPTEPTEWRGTPATATTSLTGEVVEVFRLSKQTSSPVGDSLNLRNAGLPSLAYDTANKNIPVTGRSADWNGLDIIISVAGFRLRAGDEVVVVGRVANSASGGSMVLSGAFANSNNSFTPPDETGPGNRYPWLANVGIPESGPFTLRYIIPDTIQGEQLLAGSPIRIQTGSAGTMSFIIDDILIARIDGEEVIPDPKPIEKGSSYLRISGRGADWHAVDIRLANVGFTAGSSYEFVVTGRVHEPGEMKISQTSDPWDTRGSTNSNLAGDFEIRQTFTYEQLQEEIAASQNFRITTGAGKLGPFDIYNITISRVGGEVIYSMQSDLAGIASGTRFEGTNVLQQAGGPTITVMVSDGGAPPPPNNDVPHDCSKDGHVWYSYNDDVHSCRQCPDWAVHSYGSNFICTACGYRHACAGGHDIKYYNEHGHNCARNCGGLNFENHRFVNFVCTGCGFKHPCADGHLIQYYNADGHNCARNCGALNFEAHNFVDDVCTLCGYNRLTGDIEVLEELEDDVGEATIDADVLISIIEAAIASGETPVLVLADLIAETGGSVITADVLRFIAEMGVDVDVLLPSGYMFTIIADSISDDVGDFDLNIDIYFTNRSTEIDGTKFPANSIVIAPNFSGEFGFEIRFTFTAEQLLEAGINGNNVRLYHVTRDGVITEMGRARVLDDGSIEFVVDRASYYVLSEEDLVAYNSVIPLPEIVDVPVDGGNSLLTVIIVIAVAVAVLGSVTVLFVVLRKQKRVA